MINFKNFFNSEPTAIGLSSLGLSKKLEDNTSKKQKSQNHSTKLQQNLSLFGSTNQKQPSNTLQLNFTAKTDTEALDSLFNKPINLNFNNNNLIG